MANLTTNDLLTRSLRIMGVIATGETAPADDMAVMLSGMQALLGSWNCSEMLIYTQDIQVFTLTPNKRIYTLGPGADLNMVRPQRIANANIILQTSPKAIRRPVDIISDDEWMAIQVQDIYAIPTKLYWDGSYEENGLTPGVSRIYLWPGPNANYQLELMVWHQLPITQQLTDIWYVPPGYDRALVFNLAKEMAPEFGVRLQAEALEAARESKMLIAGLNLPSPIMTPDQGCVSGAGRPSNFNYLTGQ